MVGESQHIGAFTPASHFFEQVPLTFPKESLNWHPMAYGSADMPVSSASCSFVKKSNGIVT